MIDRFHHIVVIPADFDASLEFYTKVLGWEVTKSWGEAGRRGAMLSGGAMKLVLAEHKADGERIGSPALHLEVHDVDARFKRLPPGTYVVRQPEDTPWGTRWCMVKDPDGNLIAFEEVHRSGR